MADSPPPLGRSFRFLTAAQFLTVFNDNAFKQTVLKLALASSVLGGDPQARAGLVFALPFLLFAVLAGDLADRVSKRTVVLAAKWAEVGVMLLAAAALGLGSLPLGLAALFLMGAQSAFLGPAKYGLLPELVPDPQLSRANGVFQASVVAGIVIGTGCIDFVRVALGPRLWLAPLGFALLAFLGALLARGIEPVPAADPDRRLRLDPFARLRAGLRRAATVPGLRRAMFGRALFYHAGAVLLFAWNEMGERLLEVDPRWWTAGLGALTLAMGLGSWLAGRLSGGAPRPGFAVLGAVAMGTGFLAAGLGPRSPGFVLAVMLAANAFSGFYLVPLMTLGQQLPPPADRGRIQGACQMLDWIGIVAASLAKEAMTRFGLDALDVLVVLGLEFLLAAALLQRGSARIRT
ncbi:MAG: MFS transporter [Planctomycetota bacterium]|nr:MAG: MFS transporter [Planctomycetota bacterium]